MKSSELIRIVKRDGWYIIRQTGSHVIFRHAVKKNQVVIPDHGSNEIGKGLASKILKQAGLK